jgi:hypothetical protein
MFNSLFHHVRVDFRGLTITIGNRIYNTSSRDDRTLKHQVDGLRRVRPAPCGLSRQYDKILAFASMGVD